MNFWQQIKFIFCILGSLIWGEVLVLLVYNFVFLVVGCFDGDFLVEEVVQQIKVQVGEFKEGNFKGFELKEKVGVF